MGARPLIVTLSEAAACAPEVATGGMDLSACPQEGRDRAEAYAVGATLYYALSGCLPYEADSPERYCRLQLESSPRPLVEVAPHLERHGTVLRLVDRCLGRSPESRPQSLDALTVDLAIAIREAQQLEGSGGFFPLRVTDSQALDRPYRRPGISSEAETAKHNRRQILVLAALVGLLFSLVYYQSHSPGLGVEETPPVIMPAEP
jgi:serine/threonine protein kinase